mgnify:CR=1 FL=1
MNGIGKTLIVLGAVLMAAGGILLLSGAVHLPLGRLPGDITITRKNFTVCVPITTMILVSLLLTAILNLIGRWLK